MVDPNVAADSISATHFVAIQIWEADRFAVVDRSVAVDRIYVAPILAPRIWARTEVDSVVQTAVVLRAVRSVVVPRVVRSVVAGVRTRLLVGF